MTWQSLLQQNLTSVQELPFSEEMKSHLLTTPSFSMSLPLRLLNKIKPGTKSDPILRQFVPLREELDQKDTTSTDPLQESHFFKTKKLLQKYSSRALILTTNACAMNCRFCFRRCFTPHTLDPSFDEELDWLKAHPEIQEVILSGGDPLTLPEERLHPLLTQLSSLPSITTIRFHTRLPIAIPERIDESLLSFLSTLRPQLLFVLHTNHAIELDDDVKNALHKLHEKGCLLLSQTVLLKGVNNSLFDLEHLMRRLIECRILPYYLHQLDRVQGAAHFEVPIEEGRALIQSLREHLPGYMIPRYVQEIPFECMKTPL